VAGASGAPMQLIGGGAAALVRGCFCQLALRLCAAYHHWQGQRGLTDALLLSIIDILSAVYCQVISPQVPWRKCQWQFCAISGRGRSGSIGPERECS
jgi:hypothetical protein